jgi:hypothetical protein
LKDAGRASRFPPHFQQLEEAARAAVALTITDNEWPWWARFTLRDGDRGGKNSTQKIAKKPVSFSRVRRLRKKEDEEEQSQWME